jgi:hypothetical protein
MRRQLATVFFLPVLACGIGSAQVSTGTLSGFVTDPSGAVVSGAAVQIRDLDTGVSGASLSNETGLTAENRLPDSQLLSVI